ncbi:MAG: hypothetical protein HYW28_11155 [Rhodospirillales bacterium]|nr:hypothetical protein [Rhodospirillales bacterium]MBI2978795.1 hypothetical protein [Rhodospirillales bacterium]
MPFRFDPKESDRDLLASFFRQLQRFLYQFTFEPGKLLEKVNFVETAQPHLRTAWNDGKMTAHFEVASQVVKEVSVERLSDAGLTGVHLRAKLAILQSWADTFIRERTLRALFRVFKNINSFLGSFVQASGAGEIIKEFKEMCENAIDDLKETGE